MLVEVEGCLGVRQVPGFEFLFVIDCEKDVVV